MDFIRKLMAIIISILSMILFIPVLIPGVLLWLISLLSRTISYLIQPRYQPWKDLIEFEPAVGWKPVPNLNTHYITPDNDICHIITDSQGFLGKNSLPESDIVVFGDSYAFGFGVNIYDSYIEVDSRLKIKAIGSPGYNMVQELILMRRLSSQLQEKLVIWFICLQNDLYDNLWPNNHNLYRTPFVRNINGKEWEIVTSHVRATKWSYPALNPAYPHMFAKICMEGPLSQHVYGACHFLIREGHDICKKAGAHLVVMTIPSKNQLRDLGQLGQENIASHLINVKAHEINPDYPDQRIDDICIKLGVPFYTAKNFLNLKDYKAYDCHWTKQGNWRVAKFLATLYDDYISGNTYAVKEGKHKGLLKEFQKSY